MLQNSVKIPVREPVLSRASFSDDGAHSAALRKQRLVRNSPVLVIQSGAVRLSNTLFIASTEVTTVQQHRFLARKEGKCFVLETATANSISEMTPSFMEVEHFVWEMF